MFTNCERLPLQTSSVSDLVVSTTSRIRDFVGADQRLSKAAVAAGLSVLEFG